MTIATGPVVTWSFLGGLRRLKVCFANQMLDIWHAYCSKLRLAIIVKWQHCLAWKLGISQDHESLMGWNCRD
jgi:hypothetical protein